MSGDSKASVASQAHAFYSVGKYEKALECLQRLVKMGGKEDSRVQGNLVLTEHAKGGFKRPLVVRDRITALRNSLKARSGKAGPAPAALRGKESLRLDAEEDDEEEEEADDTDTDTSILLYNLAALHFHEKQYGASQHILYTLFARIEVLEEALAVHVCFLLLDVLLHSARGNIHTDKDRERFSQNTAALLAYLERPHVFGAPAALTWETEDSTSSSTSSSGGGGGGGSSSSGRSLEMAEFTFRLHLYKAKARLLLGEVKSSKKELKSALEIFQRELRPTPADASVLSKGGSSGGGGGGGDSDDEEAAAAASAATTTGNTLMGGVDASLPPAGVANVAGMSFPPFLPPSLPPYSSLFSFSSYTPSPHSLPPSFLLSLLSILFFRSPSHTVPPFSLSFLFTHSALPKSESRISKTELQKSPQAPRVMPTRGGREGGRGHRRLLQRHGLPAFQDGPPLPRPPLLSKSRCLLRAILPSNRRQWEQQFGPRWEALGK